MSVEITLGKGGHPRYKEVSDYGKLATQYSNTIVKTELYQATFNTILKRIKLA